MLHLVKEEYGLGDFFYLDTWPAGPPLLIACDPDISHQFIVQRSMPKSPVIANFTESIGGRQNMVADDGQRWKTWRSAFNPGFANSHLMTLVPDIVDRVSVYADILEDHAHKNDLFRLEKLATRVTIDIIGKVIL